MRIVLFIIAIILLLLGITANGIYISGAVVALVGAALIESLEDIEERLLQIDTCLHRKFEAEETDD